MAEFRKLRVELDSSAHDRKHIPDPPGFDATLAREQALFGKATAPFKNMLMLAFMMWMSGSQLHLFSIMATLSGVYQPLSAIVKSGEAFPPDPQGKLNTLLPRLLYCAINGLGLAFAGYRINQMGLLPTHLSDWVSSIQAPQGSGAVGPLGELDWASSDLPVWMMQVDSGVAFWQTEDGPSQDAGDHSLCSSLQQLAKAPRLRWTLGLHQKFLAACNELGGPLAATPKKILSRMGEKGLTLYHVKSHLQKFRAALREGSAGPVEPAAQPRRRRRRRRWDAAGATETDGQGANDSGVSASWEGSQQEEDGQGWVDPALLPASACLGLLGPERQEALEQGQPRAASVRRLSATSPPGTRLGTVWEAGTPEQFDEGTSRRALSVEVAEATPAHHAQAGVTGVPLAAPAATGAPVPVQDKAASPPAAAGGKSAGLLGASYPASLAATQSIAAPEQGASGMFTVAPEARGGTAGTLEPHGQETSRKVLLQQALARQLEMQQELQQALQAQRELASRLQAQQETIRSLFNGMRASSTGTTGTATATAAGLGPEHASASDTAAAKADAATDQQKGLCRRSKRSLSSSNLASGEHGGTTQQGRSARHAKRGNMASLTPPATPAASLPLCASASGSPQAPLSPFRDSLSLPREQQEVSLPLGCEGPPVAAAAGVDAAAAADVGMRAAQVVHSEQCTLGAALPAALAPAAGTAAEAAAWNPSCPSAFLAGVHAAERQLLPPQALEQLQGAPVAAVATRHSALLCPGANAAPCEVEVPVRTLASLRSGSPLGAGMSPGDDSAAVAQPSDSGKAPSVAVLESSGLPGYPLPATAGTAAAAVPPGAAEAAGAPAGPGASQQSVVDLLDGLLSDGEALDGLLLCDWSSLE
ncbi:hypothetical protein N2152v2_008586 [Parachlorella kessleri]